MQNDGAVMGTHHLMCTHCFNVFLHDLAPPNDSEVMGGSSALRQSGSTEYSQVDTLGLWYKFVNSGVKRSGLTKLARPIHTETQPDPLCHLSTPLPRGRPSRLLSFVAKTKKWLPTNYRRSKNYGEPKSPIAGGDAASNSASISLH